MDKETFKQIGYIKYITCDSRQGGFIGFCDWVEIFELSQFYYGSAYIVTLSFSEN